MDLAFIGFRTRIVSMSGPRVCCRVSGLNISPQRSDAAVLQAERIRSTAVQLAFAIVLMRCSGRSVSVALKPEPKGLVRL